MRQHRQYFSALLVRSSLVLALGLASFSCNESDFQGNAGSEKNKDNAGNNANANGEGNGDGNGSGFDANGNPIGDGVTVDENVSCSLNEVKNDTETFRFKSNNEVRAFANSFCKAAVPTAWKDQGGMRDDTETKNALCRLKGYQRVNRVVSFSWSSPGDNHVAWWVASTKSFFVKKDASKDNHMIKELICQGRLYDKCVPAKNTIDCKQ